MISSFQEPPTREPSDGLSWLAPSSEYVVLQWRRQVSERDEDKLGVPARGVSGARVPGGQRVLHAVGDRAQVGAALLEVSFGVAAN